MTENSPVSYGNFKVNDSEFIGTVTILTSGLLHRTENYCSWLKKKQTIVISKLNLKPGLVDTS